MTESLTCPACGHSDDDHRRENWYDEEGIEGMSCYAPVADGECGCQWWTWDWSEVVNSSAVHFGYDVRDAQ